MRGTESDWQATVIDYAHLRGWLVAHFRPAKTEQGWRTAVQADGAGFPDLVMVREGRIVFAELKSDTGKLSEAQFHWLTELDAVSKALLATSDGPLRVHVFCWRPKDWPEVEAILA